MRLFKDLPDARPKSDVIWLLELASVEEWRPAVVQALEWMRRQRERTPHRVVSAIEACAGFMPSVEWRSDLVAADLAPVAASEKEWLKRIETAQKTRPYQFEPPTTEAVVPDRHPWDGCADKVSFTEVSAGIGMFAAAFEAAGMVCKHLIEPVPRVLQLAVQNCSLATAEPSGLADVDPVDLEWTHGLVGGPECQPFSSAGKQRAWADPRSYTLLRTLHTMAVMRPWWVWLENVSAIATVHEGSVWGVVQEIAALAGYKVKLTQS